MDPNHNPIAESPESQQLKQNESETKPQMDANNEDIPPIINNNTELKLDRLTDELISSASESINDNYSVLFLPTYLDALVKQFEDTTSISEQALAKFCANLLLCVLPLFSISSDSKTDPISFARTISSILTIYLKLHSKVISVCESLTLVKLSQIYPEKSQTIEQFVKSFSANIEGAFSCEKGISLEAVLSEVALIFVNLLKGQHSKQIMEQPVNFNKEIKALGDIFNQFARKISCQISCEKSVPLEIIKKIAFNSFEIALGVFRSERLKAEYWSIANEQAGDPFRLEFFMNILLSTCKIENDQTNVENALFPFIKCCHDDDCGAKEHVASDLAVTVETNAEPNDQAYFSTFLEKMDQVIHSFEHLLKTLARLSLMLFQNFPRVKISNVLRNSSWPMSKE